MSSIPCRLLNSWLRYARNQALPRGLRERGTQQDAAETELASTLSVELAHPAQMCPARRAWFTRHSCFSAADPHRPEFRQPLSMVIRFPPAWLRVFFVLPKSFVADPDSQLRCHRSVPSRGRREHRPVNRACDAIGFRGAESDDQRRQSLRAKDDQFHGDHLELVPAKQRDAVQLCGATLRARNTAGWQHALFPFRKVQHCSDVHDPAHPATGERIFCPVGDCASRWAGERRV